jgi:hypothetical protein
MMGLRVGRSLGEAAASAACLLAVLAALLVADDRARERIVQAVSDGRAMSWGRQASGVVQALVDAAGDQSLAHAPLLIFTVVGALLLLFMLRT